MAQQIPIAKTLLAIPIVRRAFQKKLPNRLILGREP